MNEVSPVVAAVLIVGMKAKKALLSFFNHLNALGAVLLAYALANPSAATDLLNLLPPDLKKPAVLVIPALWFGVVQYAKARAIKKAGQA